ncbi:HAD family phosphatase [candidate division KSB1 bacterium]|nr:HAD family phosphatase [candidate division KSB1 bacterium]
MPEILNAPAIGNVTPDTGLLALSEGGNGLFRTGENGVQHILRTADKKADFIVYDAHTMVYIHSAMGYPAIYPLYPAKIESPLKAVLMDLDGTSVKSEAFWIWIIEKTTASLLGDSRFELEEADLPYVSGHSVSEHLQHCIRKYCPDKTVEAARSLYFEHTHREMKAIMQGKGRKNAFVPAPGLKDFLLKLKQHHIKIGLVTSGLHEKAMPEIYAAFQTLNLGDPEKFYDAIVTAGFPLRKGEVGTLGELNPKPHPWLYAETARVGLGIDFAERHSVAGLEDSGAGVISIRLAGFAAIGISGGNISESGVKPLLSGYHHTLEEIAKFLFNR